MNQLISFLKLIKYSTTQSNYSMF